jgi:hypothetical protein
MLERLPLFLVTLALNEATGRYHPFYWRQAALMGATQPAFDAQRYRSRGHHTAGFDTEAEGRDGAVALFRELQRENGDCVGLARDLTVDSWQEGATPAGIVLFQSHLALSDVPTPVEQLASAGGV